MEETYHLKITSAIAIDGQIKRAGEIVSLPKRHAVPLLERGKAVLATAEDRPAEEAGADQEGEAQTEGADTEAEAAADAEAPADQPAAPSKPAGRKK